MPNPTTHNGGASNTGKRNREDSDSDRSPSTIRESHTRNKLEGEQGDQVEHNDLPRTRQSSRGPTTTIQQNEESLPTLTARMRIEGTNYLQNNLHGSRLATTFLNTILTEKRIHIALIQDYYINTKTNTPIGLSTRWHVTSTTGNRAAILCNVGSTPIVLHKSEFIAAISIQNIEKTINIINVYAPPSATFNEIITTLDEVVRGCVGPVVISGDFNAHSTLWGYDRVDGRGQTMMDFIAANGLHVLNTHDSKPTFETSHAHGWPDITMVSANVAHMFKNWTVLEEESLSDHNYITFQMGGKITNFNRHHLQTKYGNHKRFAKEARIIYEQNKTKLSEISTKTQLDEVTDAMLQALKDSANKNYKRKKTPAPQTPNWFTNKLKIERNRLRAMRRRYQKETNHDNKQKYIIEYKKSRAQYKKDIIHTKQEEWKTYCTKATDTYGSQFKYFRKKNNPPATLQNILEEHDYYPDLSYIQTEFLDALFLTDPNTPHEITETISMQTSPPPLTYPEINRIITGIKMNKAPGHDDVDYNLIKLLHRTTPQLMLQLFNKCLKLNHFPNTFKKADVVLFHKQGKPLDDPTSYRPICLLPAMGKILERIIHGRISHNFYKHKQQNTRQYGFKHGISTEHALQELLDILQDDKSNNKQTMIVSLDISSAFDNIQWPDVARELQNKNCPQYLKNMIYSFLENRSVRISENGITTERSVFGGCPQGSCLGPLLWNILADSILDHAWPHHTRIQAFADDFLLIINGEGPQQLTSNTQATLNIFNTWTRKHKLNLNWKKTKLVYMNRPRAYNFRTHISTGIGNIVIIDNKSNQYTLHHTDSFKYLGLTIQKNLSWLDHLQDIRKKTLQSHRNLTAMCGSTWGLRAEIIKTWYSVVVEKIINYAAPIWGTTLSNAEKRLLLTIQRPFLLTLTKAYRTSPTTALLTLSGLLPAHISLEAEAVVGRVSRLQRYTTYNGKTYAPPRYERKTNIWSLDPCTLPQIQIQIVPTHVHIFTDGSKTCEGTGSAFVAFREGLVIHKWNAALSASNSVFQAELTALLEAITWSVSKNTNVTIHTDSLSSLDAIQKPFNTNKIVTQILNLITTAPNKVTFNWVKAHNGIIGNELADQHAKQAAKLSQFTQHYALKAPISNLKRTIRIEAEKVWQREWDNSTTGRRTHSFFPTIDRKRLIADKYLTAFYTEHGPFPYYLNRFNIASSDSCACGNTGTADHFLFDCELTAHMHVARPSSENMALWQMGFHESMFLKQKATDVCKWLFQTIDDLIT